jgi:ATP-dependent protease ClpP protease subunit
VRVLQVLSYPEGAIVLPDALLADPEIKALALKNLELEAAKATLELAQMQRNEEILLNSQERGGRFDFVGIVMEGGVHDFIVRLENWSKRNPGKGIEIILNSPGGSVLDGLALVDYLGILQSRGHKLTIIGTGMVASMAGVLLQIADERVLTKHAYFGMHEVSSYVGMASTAMAEDHLKFTKELQTRLVAILCSKSTLTKAKLTTMWKRKDIWCNAEKALELGLIDRILEG